MKPTLTIIARKAGVSPSTVSRVVNGRAQVNADTRSRVLAAVRAFRYRPAAGSSSRLLGFLMPVETQHWGLRTPLLQEGLRAMADVARASQYACILGAYSPTLDQTTEDRMLANREFEGVLLFRTKNEEADSEPFRRLGIPFIIVNRLLAETRLNYIGVDHRLAALTAAEHLLACGYRRLGLLVGNTTYISHRLYVKAFREVAVGNGMVREIDLTPEDGYAGTQALLATRPRPEALIVTGDRAIHGCLKALREARVRVPQDLGLVNLDGTQEAAYTHPPLTALEIPWYDMLSLGTRLLVDIIERRPALEQIGICFQTRLVVRKSTRLRQTAATA